MGWAGWGDFVPPSRADLKAITENAKPSKFHAKPTRGFASKKEATFYDRLMYRLRAGEITRLECQPEFVMHTEQPDGQWIKVGKCKCDFAYDEAGIRHYIEVKGGKATMTEAFRLRKRHVEAEYGIAIEIV